MQCFSSGSGFCGILRLCVPYGPLRCSVLWAGSGMVWTWCSSPSPGSRFLGLWLCGMWSGCSYGRLVDEFGSGAGHWIVCIIVQWTMLGVVKILVER